MDHESFVWLVTATIVLHNMCEVHNTGRDFEDDDVVLNYMKGFDQGICPSCKKKYGKDFPDVLAHGLECAHQTKWNMTQPQGHTNGEAEKYRAQLVEELWELKGQGV